MTAAKKKEEDRRNRLITPSGEEPKRDEEAISVEKVMRFEKATTTQATKE